MNDVPLSWEILLPILILATIGASPLDTLQTTGVVESQWSTGSTGRIVARDVSTILRHRVSEFSEQPPESRPPVPAG